MLAAAGTALFAAATFALVAVEPARAGPFDRTLVLDGVDDYAIAGDSATLDLATGSSDDLTIEAFVYVPNETNDTDDTLLVKPQAYELHLLTNTDEPDDIRFTYWFVGNDTNLHHEDISADVELTTGWHHVAVTFDLGPGDRVELFFDGDEVASQLRSIPGGLNNSTEHLYVGDNGPPLGGAVDELRLSDSIRYTGDFTPPGAAFDDDANTRALWHFDESVCSTSMADASGNLNNLAGSLGAKTGVPGAPAPTLQFFAANTDGAESASPATVTVTRTGDVLPAVDVTYAITDQSPTPGYATAGDDYLDGGGTIGFPCGVASATFPVELLTDGDLEGNELVDLTLGSPTSPATLGTPAAATLTIGDTTRRPDAEIKRSADAAYIGNDIYSQGSDQKVTQKVKRGKSSLYDLRFHNDGVADSLSLEGTPGNNRFKVTYSVDGDDVTDDITSGALSTGELTSLAYVVEAKVKVKSGAAKGSKRTISVTATSEGQGTQADAVRATTKAK